MITLTPPALPAPDFPASEATKASASASASTQALRFARHTPETAPGKAGELLGELWARHGGPVGAMVRTMAGSPSVLTGYLDLSRAMKRSRLPRQVSERISLAIQARLGCELCLDAHTAAARAAGVSEEEIVAARAGTSADPAVAAIVDYGVRVHAAPRDIDESVIDGVRAHGWSDRLLLDVVGLVSLNVLTGTFNLIAGIEPENHSNINTINTGGAPSAGHHEGATP